MTNHIVLCSGASLSQHPPKDWDIIYANQNSKNPNIRYEIDNVSHKLLKNPDSRVRDLLDIATYVYYADNSIKRGTEKDVFNEKWSRNFKFIIPVRNQDLWNDLSIKSLLIELLEYLTEDKFDFEFTKRVSDQEQLIIKEFSDGIPYGNDADSIILFSGGMDSLAGVVDYYAQGRKPILASHQSRNNLRSSQGKLAQVIRQKLPNWDFPQIDIRINRIGDEAKEVSQRSRSLVYLSFGALVAFEMGIKEVVVAENGVTAFNLPRLYQTYGSQASRSTHPKVISLFEKLLDQLLSSNIKITTPLLWNTRVENIEILIKNNCLQLLPLSASCNHARRPAMHPHCGTCSQCVDRRFAVEYLNLDSFEDEITTYEKDIFVDELNLEEEVMQAISPVKFLLNFRKLDMDSFMQEFGIIYDSLPYLQGGYEENVQRIFNLYSRFADSVEKVMSTKTSQNWLKITSQSLPKSCLLVVCRDEKKLQVSQSIIQRVYVLMEKIKKCPYTVNKVYEDLCEEVFDFLFHEGVDPKSALEKPQTQMNNSGGGKRRDLVFENNATEGFWSIVRNDYHASGIIIDAKNYSDEIQGDILIDFAGKYLKLQGLGSFGIVVARKIPREVKILDDKQRLSGLVRDQENLLRENKVVIVLDDNDLVEMLGIKANGGNPCDLIRKSLFILKAGL